jgi:hypothetical protein
VILDLQHRVCALQRYLEGQFRENDKGVNKEYKQLLLNRFINILSRFSRI